MNLITKDGVYYATFTTRKNTTGEVNLGTNNLEEAKSIAAEAHVEELETVSSVVDLSHQVVTQIINGENLTLSDAIDKWHQHVTAARILSPTTVDANLRFISQWARDMNIEDLSLSAVLPKHVSDHVNQGGERRSTAVRKLAAIRSFFNFCRDNGLLYRNPSASSLVKVTYSAFKHEEKEVKERGVFTRDELDKILALAEPFWFAACTLAWYTGLRLGDIAQLEWSSFKDGRLVVWTDKANKRVDLPLNDEINAALSRLTDTSIRYVFPCERDVALDPRRRSCLSVQFSRLAKKAGVCGRSFHCLRHTNATGLVESGSDLASVARRLGHTSTVTTQGYVHVRT